MEISVFEYDVAEINPTANNGSWIYSKPLVDGVYINTNSTVTVVYKSMFDSFTHVSQPKMASTMTYENGIATMPGVVPDDIILSNAEQMLVRKNNFVVRAYNGTVQNYYEKDVTYTSTGLNLGNTNEIAVYGDGYEPIPLSTYSDSLDIAPAILIGLIK